MEIRIDDLTDERVISLIHFHLAQMHSSSPACKVNAIGLEKLQQPDVQVWTAWEDGDLLGMGALRGKSGESWGEIKSMRTHPNHLGKGVGRAILNQIIVTARESGLQSILLETGNTEAFYAAQQLYLNSGFVETGPFGDYEANEFSKFFRLDT
jgi:putative acetyltransferase